MANTNSPFGLNPVADIHGRPWTGGGVIMTTTTGDGTAIGIGDPVLALGTTTANADGTYTKDVKIAATTDVIEGVVVAVLPETRDSLLYRAANTVRRLVVNTNPDTLYECQDLSTGTPIPAADIGLNVSLTIGSPSTVTGRSGATLNNATQTNSNTLLLKIVGAVSRPDNEVGAASQKLLVKINRSRFADQLAGL